ncbi:wax ester/triacylglycerol synthase family O-acyltransferase [Pyxidicoccus fallax]|uniref:diacylglycerol O-acyltransferase n=1 Tax=Pyxidicoccus fallax TaxID=394095 RepID=A0A848LUR3_9BACT|nr:wax ester/triacylglycerol synthase family O-acyltransferase [Pyxidicoccus fallax]NMO21725.1 wax ester/triacylglycerol synthase family O-acyltransferase [Pyxidicoccus fallax]NPC86009.1 wax ester/triacylglycerol synthase family O-acyltransferase [Pyxidicoccus fallax]
MAAQERMASVDALWFHMEEPANLMMITAVLWFEGRLDFERLQAVVRERLVERYPRFRQRVVLGPLGGPHWEEARDFDLDAHLSRLPVPAPGDRAALETLVGQWMSTPLERSRPLWQLHVLEGAQGGDVLLCRLHHCLADGIALARVLLTLTDDEGVHEGVAAELREPSRRAEDGLSKWMRRARVVAGTARTVLRKGAEMAAEPILAGDLMRQGARAAAAATKVLVIPQDPRTPLRGPLGTEKRAAWSDPVPLERVKALGRALGCTVNDVLLAAVTGALRRYLEARDVVPEDVHALVPVNLRPLDEPVPRELGNRFGVVFLRLPVHVEEPRRRLLELARRMGQVKRSPEAVVTFSALEVLGFAPAAMERAMVDAFGSKATLVATNVPGPREAVSLAGTKLGGLTFWVPQAGHLGLGVSLFSYAGQVTVGVAADVGRMPDPHELIRAFHAEVEALAEAAVLPAG